jgi:hypothetical protein
MDVDRLGRPGNRDHRREGSEHASKDDVADRRFHHGGLLNALDDRTGAEGKSRSIFSPIGASTVLHGAHLAIGATMTRLRPLLLLPLLAIAACQTQRKPLTGYDTPPPGILLSQTSGSTLMIWPIFDLSPDAQQIFEPRLNDQGTVMVTSDEGFYDYSKFYLGGWTAGWADSLRGVPGGTYVVELDDDSGQSWGKSAPLPVPASENLADPSDQPPAVIFAHFGDQVGSWTIDPSTKDSDPATDEITVTNLIHEDVLVQRCQITAAGPASCTSLGTVSPGADLLTVETMAPSSKADYQALFVSLASDPSQSYERDLVQGIVFGVGGGCQMERIFVHGSRPIPPGLIVRSQFAISTCVGYSTGT